MLFFLTMIMQCCHLQADFSSALWVSNFVSDMKFRLQPYSVSETFPFSAIDPENQKADIFLTECRQGNETCPPPIQATGGGPTCPAGKICQTFVACSSQVNQPSSSWTGVTLPGTWALAHIGDCQVLRVCGWLLLRSWLGYYVTFHYVYQHFFGF